MDFCIQDNEIYYVDKSGEKAAEEISRQGKKAVLTCSYAINWFGHHEKFQYIIQK